MSSSDYVGPPRLLNSEVILPTGEPSENQHCVLKINVEKKSRSPERTKEYSIDLPPSTLRTLLDSFGKIKNQLHSLTEKHDG